MTGASLTCFIFRFDVQDNNMNFNFILLFYQQIYSHLLFIVAIKFDAQYMITYFFPENTILIIKLSMKALFILQSFATCQCYICILLLIFQEFNYMIIFGKKHLRFHYRLGILVVMAVWHTIFLGDKKGKEVARCKQLGHLPSQFTWTHGVLFSMICSSFSFLWGFYSPGASRKKQE
ncbi:hypothetical protein ACJX0J_011151, partial [Zea mays]